MSENESISSNSPPRPQPWNKGKLIGAKAPLRASHVWSIRTKLQLEKRTRDRATVRQKKTGRPVRFELTEQTRQAIDEYLRLNCRKPGDFLFAGRCDNGCGLTTRQYARLVVQWIASIRLDPLKFGTHSLRRTKATLIYRRTGNLRAVQLLLGHSKIESTVRYLGIEIDDAIETA